MTRITFGVSASSFAANMSLKQNAQDFENEYPLAAKAVEENVYVDDCLTGADDVNGAILLHNQLLNLFKQGCFLLRKWNSSESSVLQTIDQDLRDSHEVLSISAGDNYTKTLGLKWNASTDHFRLPPTNLSHPEIMTKRTLASNVAKIFDVIGWFSPTTIKVKILLQRLWETNLKWDDPVPPEIQEEWSRWESEVHMLSECKFLRYYFPKDMCIVNTQLHGFSDASENAYSAVVYIRGQDSNGEVHIELALAKTRVSPLKRLSIPRLELCGAYLLSQLLEYLKDLHKIPTINMYAWTDSTIVLNWLCGSSKRFKSFVGNRISSITDVIPPNQWNHVSSQDNPADCASRGVYPSQLVDHVLWWHGPTWLKFQSTEWPNYPIPANKPSDEQDEICNVTTITPKHPIIPLTRYSSFRRIQRVTAWVLRFINNCSRRNDSIRSSHLSNAELNKSEKYWLAMSQMESFPREISTLNTKDNLLSNSQLSSLRLFMDPDGLLRVGGRLNNSKLNHDAIHPILLHGSQIIAKLIIHQEHRRLLHAGPTLTCSSISLRFHIINLRKTVRKITRACINCRRHNSKPMTQLQGQLPFERVTPDSVFSRVGVDYAGPFNIKYGYVRKPTIIKAYICVFDSLTVKAACPSRGRIRLDHPKFYSRTPSFYIQKRISHPDLE